MKNFASTRGRIWMLPLAMVGMALLSCNGSKGGAISPAGAGGSGGSGNTGGSGGPGSGTAMGSGVGWWTMPPGRPGMTGGASPGTGGTGSGNPSGGGAGTGGSGSGGGLPVTVPGTMGAPMTPHLPGGGVAGNTPLAPGCTPASATECPTINGACATGAGATVTVTKFGTLCLGGEMTSFNLPVATVEYLQESTNGQNYYRFRVTFNPHFVDNTYGVNSVGWPPNRGHRYGDLVKSDHTELMLLNGAGQLSLHFKMDYISELATRSCGYGTLGVKGGDGSMITGNPAHVLAVGTSLDRNLNGCGYCKHAACNGDCTVDSPATDKNYSTNPQTPNWDFRLVYDVWISPEAFGASGFGKANISYVHASPAKGGSDTIIVTSKPCPPGWDNPYPSGGTPGTGGAGGGSGTGTGGTGGGAPPSGGACPLNYTEYLTSEGKVTCVANPVPNPGGGYTCPMNWMVFETASGGVQCVPRPTPTPGGGGGTVPPGAGGTCPINYELYVSSEGRATCVPSGGGSGMGGGGSGGGGSGGGGSGGGGGAVPVGPGGTCPVNYEVYVASEGREKTCLPSGTGGLVPPGPGNACPVNWEVYVSTEGKAVCVPSGGKGGAPGAGVPPGPGNTCPFNYEVYIATEGRSTCLPGGGGPIPIGEGGTCPAGYQVEIPMEGRPTHCIPIGSGGGGGSGGAGGSGSGGPGSGTGTGGGAGSGVSCPIDWTVYVTTEGQATCTPTPRGGSCPVDWTSYVTSEGKATCVPTPRNGACPEGYKYDVASEGRRCL